jgi:hypothetical protein
MGEEAVCMLNKLQGGTGNFTYKVTEQALSKLVIMNKDFGPFSFPKFRNGITKDASP